MGKHNDYIKKEEAQMLEVILVIINIILVAILLGKVSKMQKGVDTLMANLDELVAAVALNASVVDSAVLLINDIAAKLAAAATDPAEVTALAASLTAKADELAAAVAANTEPVVEEPPAEPPVI